MTHLSLTYLASPYTSREPGVAEMRFDKICKVAGKLIKDGHLIFCPIAHSHPISLRSEIDQFDHDVWMRNDIAVLAVCDALMVCKLEGWKESKGVQKEIEFATLTGMKIIYLDQHGNEVEED